MKRVVHKFDAYLAAEEAFGDWALEYRRRYGRPMDIGLRSDVLYGAWRRLGKPEVRGGGKEPVYFNTMTFAGLAKIFEDQALGEYEFSVVVPDE